jgi:serine/threonine-protein kinase
MYKDIRDVLGLDELFRPQSFNQHQLEVINPLLLHDPATGLYWQRCGSGFALDWQQAHAYIDYLNRERFQNRSVWRLPTTEELVSILRSPTVMRDFCIDPHFEPTLHWLWSADHSTRKQAWMADIVESYIGRQDRDGTAMVCAVTSESG